MWSRTLIIQGCVSHPANTRSVSLLLCWKEQSINTRGICEDTKILSESKGILFHSLAFSISTQQASEPGLSILNGIDSGICTSQGRD